MRRSKKNGRRHLDAVKQLLCERFLNLPMRHAHGLVGCSSLALKFGYWLLFDRTLGRFFPELLKLFELAKQGVVDAGRARFKDLLAAQRDFEMSAPCAFDQAGLAKIGLCPVDPVAEDRLLARGKHLRTLFRRQAELFGEGVNDGTYFDFAI